ncbi:SDR family oxidoreductase [Paenibacillus periandrae]|uniref:SDR family oxidoreductase n=1 Tax=Paenibacillus periandrae TaxID=1761741 RepID=UPI001F0894EF|nr:SDR family oxidoreductase [Paenibacillus periandrae]
MIIVTGANGKLGRAVVGRLLQHVPASQLGVSVREPKKAYEFHDLGVRVRLGNFEDAETLLHAFEGASQVLIVSSGSLGEAALRQHQTAIDAASKAGASRVLYTSHIGASPTSPFEPMTIHAATEEMLKASGIPFTSFRNGYYSSSGLMFMGHASETGELIAPEDGPVAWTSHADLAEAIAMIIVNQNYEGITPNLTSSQALDMSDIAAIASRVTGRPIRRTIVTDEQYRDALLSQGIPEFTANLLPGIFRASRRGDFAKTDSTLADLIGHAPISFEDSLKETLSN